MSKRSSESSDPEQSARYRIRAQWVRVGGDDLAVVGISIDDSPPLDGLTEAEKDVALRLLRGQSNAEIAQHRGTKLRTVANQVGSIFRKIGVSSRAELVAWSMHARVGLTDQVGAPRPETRTPRRKRSPK